MRKILSIDEFVNEERMFESELSNYELIAEAESLKDKYKKYFASTLETFGAHHLSQLPREKRGEFFAKLKEGWEKGMGVKLNERDRSDIDYRNAKSVIAEMDEKIARLSKDIDEAKDDEATHRKNIIEECKKKKKIAEDIIKNYKGHLTLQESANSINEAEIKTDEEFKSWAEEKLKKMHGDKYDQAIADKTIEGLLKTKKDDNLDYGAIIGMLNK